MIVTYSPHYQLLTPHYFADAGLLFIGQLFQEKHFTSPYNSIICGKFLENKVDLCSGGGG